MTQTTMVLAVLIAATLPFVASIIIALSPSVRATSVGGYFLYERNLDTDGFVKVTVGYSLQVAALALFFYWTFNYGAVGPTLVCVAWGSGYFLVARALERGRLSAFLGSGRSTAEDPTPTIHGYIGAAVAADHRFGLKSLTIAAVALASIIGLGGTMMAEIDYGVGFLTQALGLTHPPSATLPPTSISHIPPITNILIAAAILTFTILYVLWGGYRSAVATDRVQVPFAYVSFALFTLGVAVETAGFRERSGVSFALLIFGLVIGLLLWRRLRLIQLVSSEDVQGRLSALFTFVPILIFTIISIIVVSNTGRGWDLSSLYLVVAPDEAPFLGFHLWGLVALLTVNLMWQFVDISSLQRLQSLESAPPLADGRLPAAEILRAMGVEAGLGWFLIIVSAIILRSAGLRYDWFVADMAGSPSLLWLVPLFIFTVFVYMLSTISGFISALSYISFYDIVPVLTGQQGEDIKETDRIAKAERLRRPRATTIGVISLMLLFYTFLRLLVPNQQIGSVLYAIYAFQIVIMPSVIIVLFRERWRLYPSAVIGSVLVGIFTAYLTAAHPWGLTVASWIGADEVSRQVLPPLLTALTASGALGVISVFWNVIGNARRRKSKSGS